MCVCVCVCVHVLLPTDHAFVAIHFTLYIHMYQCDIHMHMTHYDMFRQCIPVGWTCYTEGTLYPSVCEMFICMYFDFYINTNWTVFQGELQIWYQDAYRWRECEYELLSYWQLTYILNWGDIFVFHIEFHVFQISTGPVNLFLKLMVHRIIDHPILSI